MSLPWSLRGRLLLGAALWTVGLFFLAHRAVARDPRQPASAAR